MVNLHRVQPRRDIQVANDYAVTYELHCTASGKLWLSFMTPQERRSVYEEMEFNRRTEHTITDPEALEREVRQVAERGYALEITEHSPYINGLAAPVFDHTGEIAASLSIIGPTPILTMQELERLTPRVLADAREISRLMGYEQS
jgi:DNA-binding IclR family transcriptional regulator